MTYVQLLYVYATFKFDKIWQILTNYMPIILTGYGNFLTNYVHI